MANIYDTGDDDADIVGTAGNDKIYGYGGDDTLDGGAGNDVLYGGDGNDHLIGDEGNDQMSGGDGDDYMVGGNGDDTYFVEQEGDEVIEFNNGGRDTVVSFLANYKLDANVENLTIGGSAVGNGSGNELANSIKGNSARNDLKGFEGNDSIYGFGGDDFINGGAGDDNLNGGSGIDTVTFKVGALLNVGATVDIAKTGRQNTGYGSDSILAFENIEGTDYADTLYGDNGVNKISGLAGGDIIRGRGGDDDLTGGAGADTFIFEGAAANGVDRIRSFTSGSDTLKFYTADGYAESFSLTSGTTAVGVGAQFIYDSTSNNLWYDADGVGGADQILIANLYQANLAVTDIVVTAGSIPTI